MLSKPHILSRGIYRFENTTLGNPQIIHNITKNINLDGFQIESVAIFENPMRAIVHLAPTSKPISFIKKLWYPKLKSSTLEHNLTVRLNLTERDPHIKKHKLNFLIEANESLKPNYIPAISRYADKLSQNIINSLATIEESKKLGNYPRLVFSS